MPHDSINERGAVTSLAVSSDDKYVLVSTISQELHLWDLERRTLVHKFVGYKQEHYVIRSCFGGPNEMYIASGSEDAQIYIWHRRVESPVKVLEGHAGVVNCVSWCPTNAQLLASAGDDGTVRLWIAPTDRHGPSAIAQRPDEAKLAAAPGGPRTKGPFVRSPQRTQAPAKSPTAPEQPSIREAPAGAADDERAAAAGGSASAAAAAASDDSGRNTDRGGDGAGAGGSADAESPTQTDV